MSLPDLFSSLDLRSTSSYYTGKIPRFRSILYKGETADIVLSTRNNGLEAADAFDIDLYIYTGILETTEYLLGTYSFTDGLKGNEEKDVIVSLPLPDPESSFWGDLNFDNDSDWIKEGIYFIKGVVDPDDLVAESNENNNIFDHPRNQVSILETDLPVINFRQNDNTLEIELTEPAPAEGLAINYQALTTEFHIDKLDDINPFDGGYDFTWVSDYQRDRLYVRGGSYHDLNSYNYYDPESGYYDSKSKIYHNADDSYYDIEEKLFYDVNSNSTELTDNSAEYTDSDSSPRYYLPTGGYISLVDGYFYDALGGRINTEQKQFLFNETATNGLDISKIKQSHSIEIEGVVRFPIIATPELDYKLIAGSNITDITNTTVTIAPGEDIATVKINFLADSIFDPSEIIQLQLLEDDEQYVVGHSSVSIHNVPKPNLEDLQNPRSGNLNFSVDKNAKPGTVVGHVNFSDPQGDELIYSLVDVELESDSFDRYTDIDIDLDLIENSNQDLDGDGIHPFTIDANTGTITLTDFDDLDREPENNIVEEDDSQLYNSGYYQLFVRVTDTIPTEEDFQYSTRDLYETSIVNIQVMDLPATSGDDSIVGSQNHDVIKSLAGKDTVRGGSGKDSLNGGADRDLLFGGVDDDFLVGGDGFDTLYGGKDNDVLIGSIGGDLLVGSEGYDTLYGGKGNDRMLGGLGNDKLLGGLGSDTLNGIEDDDLLKGDAQNDFLNGGDGNDTLQGGAGIDRLNGNDGEDIFVLEVNSGQDLIVDFEDGIDLMRMPVGMSFEQLNILDVPVYSATMIQDSLSDRIIAVLPEIEADLITPEDFIGM